MSSYPSAHTAPPRVRLVVPPAPLAPKLDEAQAAVAAHTGSPLLVLAGPGTGKTATITESVVARIDHDRIAPDDILVLTFSRVAAAELRARIGARLSGTATPQVSTFHSFAWDLLTTHGEPETLPKVLLSGPEQDAIIRELLGLRDAPWYRDWPAATRLALDTGPLGFAMGVDEGAADAGEPDAGAGLAAHKVGEFDEAESDMGSAALAAEVVRLMAAARAHGWEPGDLVRHADAAGIPEWRPVAALFEEYLNILDYREAVDYSELVYRATLLVRRSESLPGRYRAIYVDEYQDTDPAQVELLRALVVPGTTMVAVGDPDQAIYRFRGADVRGIMRFGDDYAHAVTPTGRARTDQASGADRIRHLVLGTTRRFGPQIRAIADAWITPVSLAGMPVQVCRAHRSPACVGGPGTVDVLSFDSAGEQAAGIADILRRARFEADSTLQWSDMAVLVRSGVSDIPRLQQALLAAGVPVEVPASDQPLAADPALAVFLTGVRLAVAPHTVAFDDAESFLTSPLVGMTPLEVRRLLRGLRQADRKAAEREGRPVAKSRALMARLFAPDAAAPDGVPDGLAVPVAEVLGLLDRVERAATHPEEALWALWTFRGGDDGGAWAAALRRQALAGGPQAFAADAALDAIVELFRVAGRAPAGMNGLRFVEHLAAQQLPAARPDDGAFVRDSVRLLTAHRSKGGQWPLVVVVGMQQDLWPSTHIGGSLLAPDRIGLDGPVEPLTQAELLADERRLAFVAATRAQQRLVITAVAESAEGGAQPSELFAEAVAVVEAARVGAVPPVGGTEVVGTENGVGTETGAANAGVTGSSAAARDGVRSHLTPASVVASLRTALAAAPLEDEATLESGDLATATVAAGWLRRLADGDIAPQADPSRWWGTSTPTEAATPLADPDTPLALSASAVESVTTCPLRWFLDRRVKAGETGATNAGYGSVVHAVIAGIINKEISGDAESVEQTLASVWGELGYSATWESDVQQRRARADIARFVTWLEASKRRAIAAETEFDTRLSVAGQLVRLRGSIDILDVADAGEGQNIRVVDVKTGMSPPTREATETHIQLGTYQLALQSGDVAGDETPATLAGGLLLYVSKPSRGKPTERLQPALTDPSWLLEQVAEAADTIREEQVIARVNDSCRTCSFVDLCPAQTHVSWIDSEGGQS